MKKTSNHSQSPGWFARRLPIPSPATETISNDCTRTQRLVQNEGCKAHSRRFDRWFGCVDSHSLWEYYENTTIEDGEQVSTHKPRMKYRGIGD